MLDGYHTDNIQFGILTITLPSDVSFVEGATYKIYYGNKTYMGDLEQNPFDFSLMADTGFMIQNLANISVLFTMNGSSKYVTIDNITNTFNLDYNEALDLFVKGACDKLSPFVDGNKLLGEVYIKIKYNKEIDSNFYYLIRVIDRVGNTVTGMINPITKELLAVV